MKLTHGLSVPGILALMLVSVTPASAQWMRVTALPADMIYSLHVNRDTLVAGGETAAWISTNAGVTWTLTAPIGTAPAYLDAVAMVNRRLWAGTGGQGVFTSDDLGQTWQSRSDGLAGGLFGSHNYLNHFVVRGDSLYAATGGAGVFVRPLRTAGPWQPTGSELVANQAGDVQHLAVHDGRMLAVGGLNGQAFHNDGGAPWFAMNLDPSGIVPDLGPSCVAWTGTAWLVGTNHGFYRSADGLGKFEFVGLNYSSTLESRIAAMDGRAFVCVNRSSGGRILWTHDDGASWAEMGTVPAWVNEMALTGPRLWAARTDGLWSLDISQLGVEPATRPVALGLALVGPHPVRNDARLAFRLPADGPAHVEVLDVAGRRVLTRQHAGRAGDNQVTLALHDLPSGVYHARVRAGDAQEAVRFVRVRS